MADTIELPKEIEAILRKYEHTPYVRTIVGNPETRRMALEIAVTAQEPLVAALVSAGKGK